MYKVIREEKQNHGESFSVVARVMDKDKEIASRRLTARSLAELENTTQNYLQVVTQAQADFEAVTEGEWAPPTPEPVPEPVPPTEEELKAQDISAKEMELEQEIERAKREREAAELAQSDTGVADKLAELEALRNTKR